MSSDTKRIVLCEPLYISTDIPNNKWMEDYPPEERVIDKEKALAQFYDMYSIFSQYAIVYLAPPEPGFQDAVYITNQGARLPHLEKTVVLANFKAQGRHGEEIILERFLKPMGYNLYRPPSYFEGEAELKWLTNNVYIGGYGIRTDLSSLEWIEQQFNAKVIKVEETDEYLYHLDCSVFPISEDYVIVYKGIGDKAIREIRKYAKVIKVDKDMAYCGITNSVRLGWTVFNSSNITELEPLSEEYKLEKKKNKLLANICYELGLDCRFINLSEFLKSGALMSCCVFHLEYDRIKIDIGKLGK